MLVVDLSRAVRRSRAPHSDRAERHSTREIAGRSSRTVMTPSSRNVIARASTGRSLHCERLRVCSSADACSDTRLRGTQTIEQRFASQFIGAAQRAVVGHATEASIASTFASPSAWRLSGVAPREIEVTAVRLDTAPTPARYFADPSTCRPVGSGRARQRSLGHQLGTRGLLSTRFRRRDRRALAYGGFDCEFVHEATHAWLLSS